MASPAADLVVLDTLGMLYAHGHGIGDIAWSASASSTCRCRR
jgi:hypothetical protein